MFDLPERNLSWLCASRAAAFTSPFGFSRSTLQVSKQHIEALMTRQGEFYDALEAEISTLESLEAQLQPPPEETVDATVH